MPSIKAEQVFEVTFRNRSGDMTSQKTIATGVSNTEVRKRFESMGYQVMGVVYKRLTGRSIQVSK